MLIMYSCWLVVGVPMETADDVADHLHLVLWSKMQFLKNRLFLPHCSSSWLVVEYVLEVPTLQALNALVVHPDWVEGLPPLLVLVKDQVIQLLDILKFILESGTGHPFRNFWFRGVDRDLERAELGGIQHSAEHNITGGVVLPFLAVFPHHLLEHVHLPGNLLRGITCTNIVDASYDHNLHPIRHVVVVFHKSRGHVTHSTPDNRVDVEVNHIL